MTKLNPALKITLIIIATILAVGAIATPIILLTNANSDTSLSDHPQPSVDQNTPTDLTNPEPNPDYTEETHLEEELRARRDQQRRSDMVLLQSAVTQFQVNNNGKLPGQGSNLDGQGELVYQPSKDHTLPPASDGTAAKLIAYYLNPVSTSENYFIDPDGWTYGLTIIDYDHYKDLPEKDAAHMVYLLHQTRCDAATGIARSDKPRDFAILYKLETDNLHYCLDSQ